MAPLPLQLSLLVAHIRIAGIGIENTAAGRWRQGWGTTSRPRVTLLSPSLDDGAIRVWKNFADLEKNPEMVTAWQGLSDMLPTTRGRSGSQTHCRQHELGLDSSEEGRLEL